jgi:hypothetical protein
VIVEKHQVNWVRGKELQSFVSAGRDQNIVSVVLKEHAVIPKPIPLIIRAKNYWFFRHVGPPKFLLPWRQAPKRVAFRCFKPAATASRAACGGSSNNADQQAQLASKAGNDTVSGTTDSAMSAAATAVLKARDAAKRLAPPVQASAAEAERLRDKIRSDTGG